MQVKVSNQIWKGNKVELQSEQEQANLSWQSLPHLRGGRRKGKDPHQLLRLLHNAWDDLSQ